MTSCLTVLLYCILKLSESMLTNCSHQCFKMLFDTPPLSDL